MIVTAGTVRKAVEATLKAHLQDALTVIGTAEGLALPFPRSWHRLPDFTDLAERLSPAVVVSVPGVPVVVKSSRDVDQAYWAVRAVFIVAGQDFEETTDRVAAMVAAGRATLNSWPSLGGLASSATWLGEEYDLLSRTDARTTGAGAVDFRFLIATDRKTPTLPILAETVETHFDVDETGGPTP